MASVGEKFAKLLKFGKLKGRNKVSVSKNRIFVSSSFTYTEIT